MTERAKRILLVDDDEGVRTSLTRILRASGHNVLVAHDGYEAVKLIQQELAPDLLLIDIRMPGMDGVETFEECRKYCPELVAIFMTAYSSSERTIQAAERGALQVLSKPLEIPSLLELITASLSASPVLIADDDPVLLRSIARALRANGILVETASSLKEAARLLRQRPNRVVVADVFLEDGHGYELLREDLNESGDPSLILITGHADWLDGETAQSLKGKALFLPKPLNIEQLIEQVNRP